VCVVGLYVVWGVCGSVGRDFIFLYIRYSIIITSLCTLCVICVCGQLTVL